MQISERFDQITDSDHGSDFTVHSRMINGTLYDFIREVDLHSGLITVSAVKVAGTYRPQVHEFSYPPAMGYPNYL